MFFKSPEHHDRFLTAMRLLDKLYEDGAFDAEYGAALYILTADLSTWDRVSGYVRRGHGINITQILKDLPKILKEVDFSGGYSVLLQLAGNLFNGSIHVDPVELMRLDEGNFKVALTAIQLRRYPLPVTAVK